MNHHLVNAEFQAEVVATGTVGFPCAVRLVNANFLPSLLPFSTVCWPLIKPSTELDAGKVYTVYVTHCESMLDFWVQDSSVQETLDRFHAKIHAAVQAGAAPCLEDAGRRPGAVCIARYRGSDQFYRAVLKEVNWHGACVVVYIDYGDSAIVESSDLWPLPEEFTNLSLQAIRCSVTAGSVTLGASDFRRVFASGLPITVRIRSKTPLRYLVEIMTDVKSLSKSSAAGSVQVLPVPKVTKAIAPSMIPVALTTLPHYQSLTLADAVWHDVCISCVDGDGSFYCQLLSNAHHLNDMMTALNQKPLQAVTGALVSGMAGVVRDPADGCVYRAQVSRMMISRALPG
jgi:Tudor domain